MVAFKCSQNENVRNEFVYEAMTINKTLQE